MGRRSDDNGPGGHAMIYAAMLLALGLLALLASGVIA